MLVPSLLRHPDAAGTRAQGIRACACGACEGASGQVRIFGAEGWVRCAAEGGSPALRLRLGLLRGNRGAIADPFAARACAGNTDMLRHRR